MKEHYREPLGPGEVEIGQSGWIIDSTKHAETIEYYPIYVEATQEQRYWHDNYIRTSYRHPGDRCGRRSFDSNEWYDNKGYLYRVYATEEDAESAINRMLEEIKELKEKSYKGIKYITARDKKGFKVCEVKAFFIEEGSLDPFHECKKSSSSLWYLESEGKVISRTPYVRRHVDMDLQRAIFDTREEAEAHCKMRNERVEELRKIKEKYLLSND